MHKHLKYIIAVSFLIFAFIYPYTKEVKQFRTNDITWKILNTTGSVNEFDSKRLKFIPVRKIPAEVEQLNGQLITIKGFYKLNNEHKQNLHTITETVTEVCFMCQHDEHHNIIVLENIELDKNFKNIKNDSLIKVSGIFKLKKTDKNNLIYHIENTKLLTANN